ncbi:unnamed protein product [Mytilus coruscus]|uniref:G-protein coupled receptors family 1 profile domain-containing protein n=1 Tax=Mytilus coruscus TaxID=42192 RepID=A0A6J8ASW0_MYTCO|nr:unnamed protein product [Mytilus coruscus]
MRNYTEGNFTLEELNNDMRKKLLAPLVYLLVLTSIGIPGNIFVIFIFKQYKKDVFRTIILNLALVDIVFCVIGIPFNIVRILYYYTFKITWICQVFVGVLDFGIMYSTHLLMLLSIHRFRQICTPLKSQITQKNVKYFVLCCSFIGLTLSAPQIAVLQPLEKIQLTNNITGLICAVTWKDSPTYWRAYNFFLTGLFLSYASILFAIYTLIGKKIIFAHRARQKTSAAITATETLSNKMTKIAFTVSVVFAISYLPLFINELVSKGVIQSELTPLQFATLKITERSYLINHVANPFIYAAFDHRFRHKLKTLCRCTKNTSQNNQNVDFNNIYIVNL